jgi:hypothetical protein
LDDSERKASIGPRHIWWNIVSSSKEPIEQGKEAWRQRRFALAPGDEKEFIPLRDTGAGPAPEGRAVVQRCGAGVRRITGVGHARFYREASHAGTGAAENQTFS